MRSRFDRHPRRFPVSKPATKGGLGHRQPVLLYEIVTVLEHGVSGVLVSQIDTDGSLRLRGLGFGLLGLLLAILLHGWSDLLGTLSAVCAVPLARVPRPAVSSHLLPCRRASARRPSDCLNLRRTPGGRYLSFCSDIIKPQWNLRI